MECGQYCYERPCRRWWTSIQVLQHLGRPWRQHHRVETVFPRLSHMLHTVVVRRSLGFADVRSCHNGAPCVRFSSISLVVRTRPSVTMPLGVVKLQAAQGVRDGSFQKQNRTRSSCRKPVLRASTSPATTTTTLTRLSEPPVSTSALPNNGEDDDEHSWPATYTQHWRVGKAWLASWILKQEQGIAAHALVAIDSVDYADGLRRLVGYAAGMKHRTPSRSHCCARHWPAAFTPHATRSSGSGSRCWCAMVRFTC